MSIKCINPQTTMQRACTHAHGGMDEDRRMCIPILTYRYTHLQTSIHSHTHRMQRHVFALCKNKKQTNPPTYPPTHPPTHARTHARTHPPTHPPTHARTHARTHAPTHPRTHPRTHAPTHAQKQTSEHHLTGLAHAGRVDVECSRGVAARAQMPSLKTL